MPSAGLVVHRDRDHRPDAGLAFGRGRRWRYSKGSVCRFESGPYVGGYPPAFAHFVPVLTRPVANRLDLFLGHRATDDLLAHDALGLLDLVTCLDEALQLLAKPSGVLGAEVDLQILTIQGELDGLDALLAAIEIIYKVRAFDCDHVRQDTGARVEGAGVGPGVSRDVRSGSFRLRCLAENL